MSSSYYYTKSAQCCGGQEIVVKRDIFLSPSARHPRGVATARIKLTPAVVEYKALSQRNGNLRGYGQKVGVIGSRSTIGQVAQSAVSFAVPGDLSKLRSPVRSGAWSAITPGLPGAGIGGVRRSGRTHRCPEGYQYGGRFTDNRFSTCGQKLFDIPAALGETIEAIRRRARNASIPSAQVTGRDIGPGAYSGNVIDARRPQIPRVGVSNPKSSAEQVKKLTADMGQPNVSATRMVRRDGFVLQPVVSAGVLRTIPDNRDMEGATYLQSLKDVGGLGGDELGLLSNTGVSSVRWVLPGGSSISISKVRPLTVGERRKLGRTVNQAIATDNRNNPLARLRLVADETGDGIAVTEDFVGIDNPKKMVTLKNGKTVEKWVAELLLKKKPVSQQKPERDSRSMAAASAKITDLDEALAHLNKGGSPLDIAPSILQQALSKRNLFKVQGNRVTGPNNTSYEVRNSKKPFEHINASLALDAQQHLGLESPDLAFVGKGDKRRYLIETPESVIKGAEIDRNVSFDDASPADVATLLVADFLSGVDDRKPSSVAVIRSGDKPVFVATENPFALTELSKISISKRTKMNVEELRSAGANGIYGKYFRQLKQEQQVLFRQQLTKLIARAGKFNTSEFKQRLLADGEMSSGEKAHLDILGLLYETRLSVLKGSLSQLVALLGGKK